FDSLNLFLEGIDLTLSTLGDLFDGEVFGLSLLNKLPLVGDVLSDAAGFMDDIRNDIIAPLQGVLGNAPALAAQLIEDLRAAMEDQLGAGSTVTLIAITDGVATVVDGPDDFALIESADEIMFDVTIDREITLASFDANFGIPVLGFTASDPIDVILNPVLHL